MKIYSILITSLLFFSLNTLALEKAAVDDESCRQATQDQYETPTRISEKSQKYAHGCVDTDRFRPAIIIENSESKIKFANYLHEGKYWIAEISKTAKIEALYFQIVRFSVVSGVTAAHSQFRIRFAPGSEVLLENSGVVQKVNDVVVSYEAARPKDVPYNFALGAVDNYVSVARVLSGQQRLDESPENITEQYELNLAKPEAMQLLLGAIEQGDREKFSKFYNTLKPNCTTEVFDLMDQLPSLKPKKHEPFLTVISNDPVAGPSLKALEQRNILVGRYANLRDEVEKGISEAPKEEPSSNSLRLLPEVKGSPYSIVLMTSKELQNDKLMSEVKAMAYNLAPQLAQRLGSSLMLSGEDSSFSLLGSLNQLSPILKEQLVALNDKLDGQSKTISLYMLPWNESGRKVNVLEELGVQARLPFETYEASYSPESISTLNSGMKKANQAQGKSNSSFGLMGLAIHFYLVKDQSQVTLQAIGTLGSLDKAMVVKNDQVNIDKLYIPKAQSTVDQPIAIVNLSQNMSDDKPEMKMHLGPYGGLAGTKVASDYGKLQVDSFECNHRRRSTPTMQGTVAKLSLIDVWFNIFSVEFDLEAKEIKTMDVRVTSGIAGLQTGIFKNCNQKDQDINQQFSDNANQQLTDYKEKMNESPGLSLLNQMLNNNKEDKVSGF